MKLKKNSRAIWYVVLLYRTSPKQWVQYRRCLPRDRTIYIDNTEEGCIPKNNGHESKEIIRLPSNPGYAASMNQGIVRAIQHKAEWIVVCNDDLHFTQGATGVFEKSLLTKRPGVYGPEGGSLEAKRYTTIVPSTQPIYISGSCMAIHSDVVRQVGLFDESYYMYYEDVDFCLRAKKKGYDCIVIPSLGISHPPKEHPLGTLFLKEYYLARNHLAFVYKCAPFHVRLYEFLRLPKTLFEHIAQAKSGARDGIIDFLVSKNGKRKEQSK